jgi:hypothetical protein
LREPVDVTDALARDRLVKRLRKMRANAVLDKNTIEWYNQSRLPPGEQPLDSSWCDEVIAWCDGGPLPACANPTYKKRGGPDAR